MSDTSTTFLPASRALALEPRLLYDAAAGVAVEHQQQTQQSQPDGAPPPSQAPDAHESHPAGKQLLVIDARVNGASELAQSASPGTEVLVVEAGQDGVAAVLAALERIGQVSSIQILGHGTPGEITLGTSELTASSGDTGRTAGWASHLSQDADILLYGCRTGAGAEGQALIQRLASVTGADVAASTNDTGATSAGGDWVLEASTGPIETRLDVNAAELDHYSGLLANAAPTTTLGSAGETILIGGDASINVTFTNPSSQPGYAPYLDVLLPSTGYDGDDGVSFVSATYLGTPVTAHVVTFGADGTALHPIARDASGNPLVIRASDYGYRAGDQLVVLELPYASFSNGQPSATVTINVHMSDLADANRPHVISVRGGFQFGNDALDNPAQDPSLVETAFDTFTLQSTPLELTQTTDMVEGETATGENFEHSLTVTATPAPGQTLNNVAISQNLPGTIRVDSITPGAGGNITSLTLADGTVYTDAGDIATVLAGGAYVQSYTVVYASISAPTSTVVRFIVPQADSGGNTVLDPVTGDARGITVAAPHATADWTPLDPRDVPVTPAPPFVEVAADGDPLSFTAKSITLHKSVAVGTDTGTPGVSPGDTLAFQYDIAVSDYFAFGETLLRTGQLTITDTLGDGMTFSGSPVMTFQQNGQTYTVPLVFSLGAKGPNGTVITFDLAQSIRNAGLPVGILAGDLTAHGTREGATIATIRYQATVDEAYQGTYPQSEINEGDSLGNTAEIDGVVALDVFNSGGDQSDGSQATVTVAASAISTDVFLVNGVPPQGDFELHPGDVVTFRLSYDLTTGDYENFTLTAYLPLPLFDANVSWSNGVGVNQWSAGPGDTHPGSVISVTPGPGNSVIFDFGSFVLRGNIVGQNRIELLFTMRVGDQPFADQRSITVLGQSQQTTTIGQQPLISADPALVQSVAEPTLNIKHGVVASTGGTVSGTTGTWSAAGTGGAAFTGAVTDIAAVDGTVTNMDAGDIIRLATAIENTGGGGAFDVSTTITLPSGLAFLNGSLGAANLRISRGDGTPLVAGVDYTVSGNSITFLDAGNQATFLAGRPGSANDTSGANVVVITYDTVAQQAVQAGQNLQSAGVLTHYASVEGGTDFTPTDLVDTAAELVAAPVVTKFFQDGASLPADSASSASQTSGANLVVGESMVYDIVVTLPEGSTQSLSLTDIVPAGMTLDTSFGNGGYQLITSRTGSGALAADFNGTVTVASVGTVDGNPVADGSDARIVFSASSALGDNVTTNNSFVIRVRLVASNVIGNQAGTQLANSASMGYTDPDGDTPNGTASVDRTVSLTGARPTVTVVEPTLVLGQTVATTGSVAGVDRGDVMTYTITITNGTGASDFNAYDVQLRDVLPEELNGVTIIGVTLSGGATISGPGDFEIVNGVLQTTAGSKLDIPRGAGVVIQIRGTVNALVGSSGSIDNPVNVSWTSLNGPSAGERTGTDGLLNTGVLNDYQVQNLSQTRVAAGGAISHVGGMVDTPIGTPTTSDPEDVAVGEIVHYRVAILVPEGATADTAIQIVLPEGMTFVNDGSTLLSFISDPTSGGAPGLQTLDSSFIIGGTLYLNGGIDNAGQTLLQGDLSGPLRAQGVIDPSRIDTSNPRVITVRLGSLVNANQDPDFEGFYFEFNARVDNSAGVQAGTQLPVHAVFLSGTDVRTTTADVVERVVEPQITNLDKSVIGFNPGVGTPFGTATYSLGFSNTGTSTAYDVVLTDVLPAGGQGLAVQSVTIDGIAFAPNALPAGFTLTVTGDQLTLNIAALQVGHSVGLVYTASLPNNVLLADTSATVTYTSLPDSFASFAGTSVGAPGTVGGERTGSLAGPNDYRDADGAGVSFLSGTLWNDTDSATSSTTPDGPGIAGQTVTLTWAGADNDLTTTADNQVFTTTTDANGFYSFGVLGRGLFRVDAPPTIALANPTGTVNARIDSDAATQLARIQFSDGDGGVAVAGSVGYVERNDPPVNGLPASPSVNEDNPLAIVGLTVSDPDAGTGLINVTLSVSHGVLTLSPGAAAIVAGALGTGSFTLQGSQADINAALATLVYTPSANFNGNETLVIRTDDRGQRGDVDGDGIPFEPTDDNLSDTDSLPITVIAVNDAPIAVADVDTAVEAGGTNNATAGVNPTGNVITNDIDVDIATNQDVLTIVDVSFGATTVTVAPGVTPSVIAGNFGVLEMTDTGGYRYLVNNSNAAVQALRLSTDTLTEIFTYTVTDLAGATSTATLTITLHGANDTPVANDDAGNATEAGGAANGTPGSDGLGNVLGNDTDVDAGDSKTVTRFASGVLGSLGPIVSVPAGGTADSGGASTAGQFGTLRIGADGSFRYVIDNNNARVQALNVGDTLTDTFSYEVTDAGGLRSVAVLTITVHGANDNPVAVDNTANASAAQVDVGTGTVIGTPVNPTGNVILDERTPATTGEIDTDVDNPVTSDVVSQIRPDATGATDTAVTAGGVTINGAYGQLVIRADGSYQYLVDSTNAAVVVLGPNDTLQDTFVYTLLDPGGGASAARLIVTVHGVNDNPVANDVSATAREAGGVANGSGGAPATGDATANDIDPDGDAISVVSIAFGGTTLAVPVGGSVTIAGQYGSLTINDHGEFTYTVNDSLAVVQALRRPTDTLSEVFTYTDSDGTLTSSALIHIRITGTNDNPVAVNDTAIALEAGGAGNAGIDPIGNVLTNDSDVDAIANGETKTVAGARAGAEASGAVADSASTSIQVVGQYGTLVLNADGTYRYVVDNANPLVDGLNIGQSLSETFTYKVRDAAGATDLAELVVTINGANDPPVAAPQRADAFEAGGLANGTPGSDPAGDLLVASSDVDDFTRTVTAFRTGERNMTGSVTFGTIGQLLRGNYGSLLVRADGTYQYFVDNDDPGVQRLRTAGDTLTDYFTYFVTDSGGLSGSNDLVIVIHGANDTPIAVADSGTAIERGGTFNGTPGQAATGNVLNNDTDIDSGDSKTATAVQTSGGATGVIGTSLTGLYGGLVLNADGSYVYSVNDSLAAVQALKAGESLTETFTYTMRDTGGLVNQATLTITILGRYDAPVAVDDTTDATPATSVTPPVDATGNVLPNDTDVDAGDTRAVTGIRAGAEAAGGTLTDVGTGIVRVSGLYGFLEIRPDGSFRYHADDTNRIVRALAPGQTLTERFTYQVVDGGGLVDVAQLTVTIHGVNDLPNAPDVLTLAVEAGGVDNTTPGRDPVGNALVNATDPENGALTVVGIRTGTETGGGTAGVIGVPLRGQYGTLVLNADGSFSYVVDNGLPEVQALRTPADILLDSFTYTISDNFGGQDQAMLRVLIFGKNDTPVAIRDQGAAIEAGGHLNTVPGADAVGNVLGNDTDVDANDTRTVTVINGPTGAGVVAGATVGRYGTLTVLADGSYRYVVDNDNPTVQALRMAGETLTEVFTYTVTDTGGLSAVATLTITIAGQNDAPVARDDAGAVDNTRAETSTSGNVLPNDSDVDGGDHLDVIGVRAGTEEQGGASVPPGTRIAGAYGFLVLNADGSYTYEIDLTNPAVLQAAGRGPILQDTFTYTVADLAGATDQAQLVITLNIDAPYVPPPAFNYFSDLEAPRTRGGTNLSVDPVVFVTPEVREVARAGEFGNFFIRGERPDLTLPPEIRATSIAAGLGRDPDDAVMLQSTLQQLQAIARLEAARMAGRQGVVSLSADGWLPDPSVFALKGIEARPEKPVEKSEPQRGKPGQRTPRAAASFSEQLRKLAARAITPADNSRQEQP
nr:VCBS domain-containing protein [uncultured Cupriavidus sp.]